MRKLLLYLAILACTGAWRPVFAVQQSDAHQHEEYLGRGPMRELQVTGHKRSGGMGSKTCMAEDQCINKYCGKGYDHTANKFPYYVNYTKWEWPGEDVFDFRICMNQCNPEERYCEPLQSWSLRLDSELIKNKDHIRKVTPGGTLMEECEETGIGYKWENASLAGLHNHHPKDGHKCEKYLMTIKHDPHMAGHFWLTDICQQRIDIVATKNGKTMFSQTSVVVAKDKFSDIGSCLVHFQTEGGVYGFTLLEDHEFYSKDTRPNENIPDLSQNPNDPFDNSRRRLQQSSQSAHLLHVPSLDFPGPGIPVT